MSQKSRFACFAEETAHYTGNSAVFSIACIIVLIWGLTGPFFDYSDTWQLVINTGTTVVTFLMVFLIQNTQNRASYAIQLKLDELLRATQGAHLGLIDLEELEENELREIRDKYLSLAQHAHERLQKGEDDSDTPQVTLI